MSRDTLDLKLNVKWNLSNIHTAPQFIDEYGHLGLQMQPIN